MFKVRIEADDGGLTPIMTRFGPVGEGDERKQRLQFPTTGREDTEFAGKRGVEETDELTKSILHPGDGRAFIGLEHDFEYVTDKVIGPKQRSSILF